jgi:Flp pilus assembly protein TadG
MIRYWLRADRSGATAIEFALLAPVFLGMIFSLVEGGRMLWIKQTLAEVAFSTARCMSVSTVCNTEAKQKSYALARAAGYAQKLVATDVVPVSNTTCNGAAGMSQVTITTAFNSPVTGLLPILPSTVSGLGCFPKL